MKKRLTVSVSAIIIVILLIAGIVYKRTEFERLKEERESVVEMLLNGEVIPKNNGLITLPEDMEKLSDSGECVFVEFQSKKALYFYSFRGMLDSTRGYIFVSDKLQDFQGEMMEDCFVNIKKVEENWYKVSTDY